MKKIILIATILLLCLPCFAVTYLGVRLPLQGETISDPRVQGPIIGSIFSKVAHAKRKCNDLSLTGTKLVQKPTNVAYNKYGRQISGTWQEEWTVNACGQNFIVPIDFELSRSGTRYVINNIKVEEEE